MKIKVSELNSLVKQVLMTKFSEKDSRRIAEVIMFGELSGKKSHGIVRLLGDESGVMAQQSKGNMEVVEKTKLSKIIEGNANP